MKTKPFGKYERSEKKKFCHKCKKNHKVGSKLYLKHLGWINFG